MAYSNYSHRGPFMATPPTTDLAIVFPYDKSSYKFDRSFYSPALTDGRISTEQIEIFLKVVERIMKKKYKAINFVSCLFAFFVFAGFLGVFCLTSETDFLDDSDLDDIFTYFITYFCFVIFGGVFLQLFIRRRQRKAKKSVKAHIQKNAQLFAPYGVRWNAPLFFPQWIELWKDYKGLGQGQVLYTQPLVVQGVSHAYASPQQTQAQAVQYQPLVQNNVNSHAVPKYQSNSAVNKTMAQPLLSQQQHIELGAYQPPSAGAYNNNANNL